MFQNITQAESKNEWFDKTKSKRRENVMDQRSYGCRCLSLYSRVNCSLVRNVGEPELRIEHTTTYSSVLDFKVHSKK